MFHSGHNPGSVDGQRPLGIQLHVGIGVAHLGNEQVQQHYNDHEEECQVNDHTKPPGVVERNGMGCLNCFELISAVSIQR